MTVPEALRNAEGICLTVTDAQAETLRRMRESLRDMRLLFSAARRPDGSRAVTTRTGTFVANLDADGYAVAFDGERWRRLDEPYDPPAR